MSELLIASEAAKLLDCTAANIRALERAGKLPALRTESGVRIFRREDVDRLAVERKQQQKAKEAMALEQE
jgi:excisionase family DNA binding protein